MGETIERFFKEFGGFIVGSIFGIILILLKVIDFIVAVLVVLIFGFLGAYIQKNKAKVKEILKNLIEKW